MSNETELKLNDKTKKEDVLSYLKKIEVQFKHKIGDKANDIYQICTWLNEHKGIYVNVHPFYDKFAYSLLDSKSYDRYFGLHDSLGDNTDYNTFEDAMIAGLKKSLTLKK